ncbi:hypothetical protein [Sphingobacterium suaedae]|uniref:Uncharacterized protein n=1 Tax=Sphingobacterium suaedae TaxID=1686402 RepID=A0ABW5KDE6_9SPHI
MKKLKALDEKSSEKSLPQNVKYETFICLLLDFIVMPEQTSICVKNTYVTYYNDYYSFIHFKNNFRPPRFQV